MEKDNSKKLAHYEPARSISPVYDLMDRFFNDDFPIRLPSVFEREMTRTVKFPKVDISENEKEIVVVANVPGMSSDNISIDVDDDSITIAGTISKEHKEGKEGETYYRFEREYGEFRREFSLPSRIDKNAVKAVTKNGVLTVTLPKINADSRKRVEVKEE